MRKYYFKRNPTYLDKRGPPKEKPYKFNKKESSVHGWCFFYCVQTFVDKKALGNNKIHLTKDVGKDVITNHHTNRKEEPATIKMK